MFDIFYIMIETKHKQNSASS